MRVWLSAIAAAILAAASIFAQAPASGSFPTFDVTSVKVNDSSSPRGGRLGAGLLEQTNVTLKDLVQLAYGKREVQGGPNWVDVERFDVMARGHFDLSAFVPPPDGSPAPVYVMLRSLLQDRFMLQAHVASAERPVYALKVARDDGRLGPNLKRADVDCNALIQAQVKGEPPPPLPPSAGTPPCSLRRAAGHVTGNAVSMGQLANVLFGSADRLIVDQTGLPGVYDLDFEWGELTAGRSNVPPPQGSHVDDDVPVFTAIRNELGLKLEATRANVEIVVIDRAEQPTQN
ncbi:MAG TPA: TIGR03435 family protein [Vicinamibacterales bacterium]|jgi:uncharacterized protein (TIGR03435 family)|nr:TIGR03435 family protein [Vicinamibacterales bacterium]